LPEKFITTVEHKLCYTINFVKLHNIILDTVYLGQNRRRISKSPAFSIQVESQVQSKIPRQKTVSQIVIWYRLSKLFLQV
jgi:hypothetical protein